MKEKKTDKQELDTRLNLDLDKRIMKRKKRARDREMKKESER